MIIRLSPYKLIFLFAVILASSVSTFSACHINLVYSGSKISPIIETYISDQVEYAEKTICPFLDDVTLKLKGNDDAIPPQMNIDLIFNSNLQTDALAYKFERSINGNKKIEIRPEAFFARNAKSLLAHEISHLYLWEINSNIPQWLDEGLSELLAFQLTQNFDRLGVTKTLSSPITKIFREYKFHGSEQDLYGEHFLFAKYLLKNCQGLSTIGRILKSSSINRESIDQELKGLRSFNDSHDENSCSSFNTVYINYLISKILNRKIYSPLYPNSEIYNLINYNVPITFPGENDLEHFIRTAKPYDAIFINRSFNLLPSTHYFHRVWVQKIHPYLITTREPQKDLKNWVLILIKR